MNLKEVDISSFWCQFKLSSKKDLIQGSCIWQMRDWNILRAAHPPWGQSLSNPWTILIQSTDQQHVTTTMLNDILSLFLNRSLSPKLCHNLEIAPYSENSPSSPCLPNPPRIHPPSPFHTNPLSIQRNTWCTSRGRGWVVGNLVICWFANLENG